MRGPAPPPGPTARFKVPAAKACGSAVVRAPSTRSEEELAIALLEQDDVLVHPGLFFILPAKCHLVLSFLPEPETFAEGVRRLLERAHA